MKIYIEKINKKYVLYIEDANGNRAYLNRFSIMLEAKQYSTALKNMLNIEVEALN